MLAGGLPIGVLGGPSSRFPDGRAGSGGPSLHRGYGFLTRRGRLRQSGGAQVRSARPGQSLARELGPQGIHVGHVVIDGQIPSERYRHLAEERGPDALLDPEAVAETYYPLHRQPRNAWTHEPDLRPWVEAF